jgi:hypothetical protein
MTNQPDISPEGVAKMLDGVTPGPWTAEPHENEDTAKYFWYVVHGGIIFEVEDLSDNVLATAVGSRTTDRHERNARFIAYAREAVPALSTRLAEVEAERDSALRQLGRADRLAEAAETRVAELEAVIANDADWKFSAKRRLQLFREQRSRAEAAEAALAATCQCEAASTIRWETKLAASAVSIPTGPGGFVGDVWFGHPTKRTLGTHKWSGSEWVELPSELDSVLQLLSEARQKLAASEARVKRLREALEFYADLSSEGPWHLPGEDYGKRARSAIERHLTDYEVKMAQLKKDFPNGT